MVLVLLGVSVLISRKGNTFKNFPRLCEGLARDLIGAKLCASTQMTNAIAVFKSAISRNKQRSSTFVARYLGLRLTDYWMELCTLSWIRPGSLANHFSATSIEAWAFTRPFGTGFL